MTSLFGLVCTSSLGNRYADGSFFYIIGSTAMSTNVCDRAKKNAIVG
jgi:hypothetical protein